MEYYVGDVGIMWIAIIRRRKSEHTCFQVYEKMKQVVKAILGLFLICILVTSVVAPPAGGSSGSSGGAKGGGASSGSGGVPKGGSSGGAASKGGDGDDGDPSSNSPSSTTFVWTYVPIPLLLAYNQFIR
nr:glycine-rich cell wall structural protein 1.0-like isoform X2 [Ipomoea trifida]